MRTLEELKDREKKRWEDAAPGWERWYAWYRRCQEVLTPWYVDAVRAMPGLRVLDLGCGTGCPAIELARRVAPGGTVLATDVSPAMVAATRRAADAAGLSNLEAREMDAESLALESGSWGAVTFGVGLMFCPEPERAVAEIRRVLAPGGRFGITVWDEAPRNRFFFEIGRNVSAATGSPPPDPNAPSQFRLSPPGALARVLDAGGFRDFRVDTLPFEFEFDSFETAWQVACDFAPLMRATLDQLPALGRDRLVETLRGLCESYRDRGSLHFPMSMLAATGAAPS